MDYKSVITADDFALDEGATDGILYCLDKQLIDSVSVCVNASPRKQELESYIAKLIVYPVSVGLHINLTEGVALNATTPQTSDMKLFDASRIFTMGESVSYGIWRLEILAQLEKFMRLFRRPPAHIDCHQHIAYLIPEAFSAMLSVAVEKNIDIRSPQPFITGLRMVGFKQKVHCRYQVNLGFCPWQRSRQLAAVYKRYVVSLKTADVDINFGDCEHRYVSSNIQSLELVSHPRIENNTVNRDIRFLEKLHTMQ
ncbi:ChbG/HpnK family deacetylase [Microbulbifer epialgicus]|uniref:ChbG/HpnK family deacetylase n=1 Tax=Microbulbifer epialgicus TaxID=393907 RepID=A0ABV4P1P1_9GAMM